MNTLYTKLKEDGFGADPGAEETFIANLVHRGASYEEERKEYKAESLSKIFKSDVFLTYAANMKITTGGYRAIVGMDEKTVRNIFRDYFDQPCTLQHLEVLMTGLPAITA